MPELCVYAIAPRQAGRIAVRGVTGERLQAIPIGRLAAIVGRVRTIPEPTDRNLRRYDRMMSALWRRTPALLPARFGTSARDLADLDAMVRDRERALQRSLRAVRNRAQMTVRVVVSEIVVARTLSGPGEPDKARPTRTGKQSGTQYLRSRQRAHDTPAFSPLRDAVRRWVRDERKERRGSVASMYHLIPAGSADRYRDALVEAAREQGVKMVVSGPWPPYAFADVW